MTLFWILCIALILAALGFVLPPLLRHAKPADPRLAALEQARESGLLDAEEYASKRAGLGTLPATQHSTAARTTVWCIALLLPLFSGLLYLQLGDLRALDPTAQVPARTADMPQFSDMDQAIASLSERLASTPDDLEGWMLLGRAYKSMERFAEARDALAHALSLSPETPAIMVEYAEAHTLASSSRLFEGESLEMLERALRLDPTNQRALWLRGIAYYQAGDTAATAETWERLLTLMPEDNPARASVRRQLEELTGETAAAESGAETSGNNAGTAADAPKLEVSLSLAPELQKEVSDDDVLFVFARATDGPRAPLASLRLRAGDLPLTVTLDDSHAMLPQWTLSSVDEVVLGARISRHGSAEAQPGDLQVVSEPLPSHHRETVELLINQRVK